ncbi:MAG: AI-2E family transporter [Acidobacteriia bacterium]|nr:AI-2E family transporter [Terriglobia bacterium]
MRRALEITIHLGLVLLLVGLCLLILQPFLTTVLWALFIAVSVHPLFEWTGKALGGRTRLAAALLTILGVAVLAAPAVLLAGTLIEGVQIIAAQLWSGEPIIPLPPPAVESWPVIGAQLSGFWRLASTNLTAAAQQLAPHLKPLAGRMLSAAAGAGLGILQLFLSILLAGLILADSNRSAAVGHAFASRLMGARGAEFAALTAGTVRSVALGIVGVGVIQAVLAGLGFLAAGLPGAGLGAVVFFVGALLQVGGVLLVPAVIYVFATASLAKAVVFLIWCVFVTLVDNFLKPMLLGRGAPVPIGVVFIGSISGFMTLGLIGFFVGSVVLSIAYKLMLAWLEEKPAQS